MRIPARAFCDEEASSFYIPGIGPGDDPSVNPTTASLQSMIRALFDRLQTTGRVEILRYMAAFERCAKTS